MFSCWMPPYEPATGGRSSPLGLAVFGLLSLVALWMVVHHPMFVLFLSAFLGVVWIGSLVQEKCLVRRARERPDEDIGTFTHWESAGFSDSGCSSSCMIRTTGLNSSWGV